jgi:CheY-like chemotaxis protein
MKQDSHDSNDKEDKLVPEDPLPLKILLVDDSVLIQKTTSRALIKEGHHVEVAQHGAECLEMLEASQLATCVYDFDLILMDLQMPVMGGLEATRRIRAMEKSATSGGGTSSSGPHIKIVGVTASTEGEARSDCIDNGMDGFMEKPLVVKQLLAYISKL